MTSNPGSSIVYAYNQVLVIKQTIIKKVLRGDAGIGGHELQTFVSQLTDTEKANCLLFLEGKIEELTALDGVATLDAINLTTQMINRLPTNEPNAGACLLLDESLHGGVEKSLVPKMETLFRTGERGAQVYRNFQAANGEYGR